MAKRKYSNNKIRDLVRDLLNKSNIISPPVPVDHIATILGSEIRYSPFDGNLSGMIFRGEDRIVIGVNSIHHPNRQRFTIAHEIGHLWLHKGKEIYIDRSFRVNLRDDVSSQGIDREEMEANRFAAELLMPYDMLMTDLEGQEIDMEDAKDVEILAERYKVSIQAMTFRLTNLFS